ncbi:hypothetical protein PAAG_00279 [Paracoccidioides lutzii Pb01]|uniref:Uncharacterized protein n=1 Tax=Paracoccidioides lutzii (strain ATCC MYA-826 / Pb01) TaxID=502779 RepID=C1GP34_PARBA|nr:hypothetical protein PAAG_00279 [Paracoccidioides lutzii Pb01]EEH35956.2 hypothetical protein PAAG_00279 [Paracoccidioides lutzii Pb01]
MSKIIQPVRTKPEDVKAIKWVDVQSLTSQSAWNNEEPPTW